MSGEALDIHVRRGDEDRWLASRFAPREARARLVAIYALNLELTRVAHAVTQPALGDMRLLWWREGLAATWAGDPPGGQPLFAALQIVLRQTPLPFAEIERLLSACARTLDAAPFSSWAELEAHLDATAGAVMRLAFMALDGHVDAHAAFVESAARAWGYARMLSAERRSRGHGCEMVPRGADGRAEALARGRIAYAASRPLAREIASRLFPAFGYLALAPRYLAEGSPPLLLERQLRLVLASARGEI